jgi:hypothetical protein
VATRLRRPCRVASVGRRWSSGSRGLAVTMSATVGLDAVNLDALRSAIKAIAVGKNGSKPMPEEVVPAVSAALDALEGQGQEDHDDDTAVLLKAALLGSLFMKLELHAHETPMLARYAGLADGVQVRAP